MCGICGHVSTGPDRPGALAETRAMAAAMAHRGPDADGFWQQGPVALGHRRLSIIDLRPEANQPITNEDGSVVAVVNGEIYNFPELRRDLEARGHVFRSRSDSETIVHLYEERGEECVTALRGMFAFAVWDVRAQRLFMARDRVGKKPLVYASGPDGFWFASELRALLAGLPERPPVDVAAIDQYLTLQYVPAPLTAYRGVNKLPAAHCLSVSPGQEPRIRRYWRLSYAPRRSASEADATAEVRELIDESVRLRRISDVPLGAFLSGGIDSSLVVALLARQSSRPVKTFSIDFPFGDGGETHFARLVARRYQTEHEELTVAPDMVSILPELVRCYGEPFADPSAVPTYYLAQMTRRHVIVALSGDGGDEGFAGYRRYAWERIARALCALPGPAAAVAQLLLERLPGPRLRPLRDFGAHLRLPVADRYLRHLAHFTYRDKLGVAGPLLREHLRRDAVAADFDRILGRSDATDAVNRLLDLDVQTYLPDDIFTKVDIASMAHALEVRAPLVDHVLLERLASLPGSYKLDGLRGKRLLRLIAEDLVPREILERRKKGFSLPLDRWMREDLASMARDLLTDATARSRGLFDPARVTRLLDEHRAGVDHGDRLWTLLVLELWHREWIDPPPPARAGATAGARPLLRRPRRSTAPRPARPTRTQPTRPAAAPCRS
jgi:asparagine synthase (glutamine-hydrolysing)